VVISWAGKVTTSAYTDACSFYSLIWPWIASD